MSFSCPITTFLSAASSDTKEEGLEAQINRLAELIGRLENKVRRTLCFKKNYFDSVLLAFLSSNSALHLHLCCTSGHCKIYKFSLSHHSGMNCAHAQSAAQGLTVDGEQFPPFP